MKYFRGGLQKRGEGRYIIMLTTARARWWVYRRSLVTLSIFMGLECFSQKKLQNNSHLQLQ